MAVRSADHLIPGMTLPSVALAATDGTSVRLDGLSDRSIVAVYPWTGRPGFPNPPGWDDIPGAHGSTPVLEGFRDLFQSFARHRTRLFGLSGQDTQHQSEAVVRLRLPFPLLSDAEGAFSRALHLPCFEAGGASYLTRLTFVARNGVIETVFDPVPDPSRHARQVLQWLDGQA